jgi:cytochrome c oxidase assembly factor 5
MPSSCKDIRAELAKCLQQSECVLINRHSPAECLRDKELFESQVPDACHRLRRNFYNCRRGWVYSQLMTANLLVGHETAF